MSVLQNEEEDTCMLGGGGYMHVRRRRIQLAT
jgi:hypothetical protein